LDGAAVVVFQRITEKQAKVVVVAIVDPLELEVAEVILDIRVVIVFVVFRDSSQGLIPK
jgi:hypothetical protein